MNILQVSCAHPGTLAHAPGSSSEASSLSGLFTRVETNHITMRSAGKGYEQIERVGFLSRASARKRIWGGRSARALKPGRHDRTWEEC